MTILTLTCVSINKIPDSNNCPMRVLVVGIIQNEVETAPNDENAVVKISVNDYTTQNINFVVNIVFLYTNSRFQYFKTSIRPTESLLFVVGELEIIKDNIYIYAKNINYVKTHIEVKKQVFDSNNSQTLTMSSTSTRSKLLATYRSIAENSGNVPRPLTSANTSEVLKDYDTTNEYFDETRDSDMKDEEESSDD
ncbi:14004_t:CDS:2, partial [Gigaspora rosea]